MSLRHWTSGLCLGLLLLVGRVVAGVEGEPVRFEARGETHEAEGGQLRLEGQLTGSVAGRLAITVLEPGTSMSGHWRLTLVDLAEGQEPIEVGSLSGLLTNGHVLAEPDGTIVGLADITVAVSEGTGLHADVTTGSGTLDLRFTPGASAFLADLALSY